MTAHTTHYRLCDPSWQHLSDHKKLPQLLEPYSFLSLFFDSSNHHLTVPDQIFLSSSSDPLSSHPSTSFSTNPHPSLHSLALNLVNLPSNISSFIDQISLCGASLTSKLPHLSWIISSQPIAAAHPYSPAWTPLFHSLHSAHIPYQLNTPSSDSLPSRTFVPLKPVGIPQPPLFSLCTLVLLYKNHPLITMHAHLGCFKIIFSSPPGTPLTVYPHQHIDWNGSSCLPPSLSSSCHKHISCLPG